jgi:hypothetical protein
MVKIGRNEQCPCRSGKKFKHCCAQVLREGKASPPTTPAQQAKISLMSGVQRIQDDAVAGRVGYRELGVFFFFSSKAGDAWLLEMTECDAVQVARGGVALEAPIDENSETIEINWSHTYQVENRQLRLQAYLDQTMTVLVEAPTRELNAAMRRIRKKFSREQLDKVHLPPPQENQSGS